jgi:5-methylcytosine-specific restriction endonuclease McrA
MKTCITCKQELPADTDHFNKNGKYLYSHCKSCSKLRVYSWRTNNKDKVAVSDKKKYLKNKEFILAQKKIYLKLNPEKFRASKRIRRARINNNGHSPYTEQQVLDLYGTNCNICSLPVDLTAPRKVGIPGWENGLHIDHVLPISKGGPDILSNVRATHGLCNITKNNKEQHEIKTA